MSKWDGMYKADSVKGKLALAQLQAMKKGDAVEYPFLPALTMKASWVLQDHQQIEKKEQWELMGYFCGIPFYSLKITVEEGKIGMTVKEAE